MDYVKLEAWRKLDAELKRIKTEEMSLRKELFKEIFNTENEGTHTVALSEGWKLKANQPYTRKLDKELMPEIINALVKFNPFLIKTEYSLSVTEYKKIEASNPIKAVVDAVLTTTPGCPSMELVPPKGEPK